MSLSYGKNGTLHITHLTGDISIQITRIIIQHSVFCIHQLFLDLSTVLKNPSRGSITFKSFRICIWIIILNYLLTSLLGKSDECHHSSEKGNKEGILFTDLHNTAEMRTRPGDSLFKQNLNIRREGQAKVETIISIWDISENKILNSLRLP